MPIRTPAPVCPVIVGGVTVRTVAIPVSTAMESSVGVQRSDTSMRSIPGMFRSAESTPSGQRAVICRPTTVFTSIPRARSSPGGTSPSIMRSTIVAPCASFDRKRW
jgi:hypothetical protein